MEPEEKVAEYRACAEQLQANMASRPNGTFPVRFVAPKCHALVFLLLKYELGCTMYVCDS